MKTKTKIVTPEKAPIVTSTKPKSLRPMRSMVAVRSLKSRTNVAVFADKKSEETLSR